MKRFQILAALLLGLTLASSAFAQTPTTPRKRAAAKAAAASAPIVEAPKPKPFTNADVLKLQANGFSDQEIVGAIEAAAVKAFDTSADALIELKNAKVSPRVIAAVLGQPYVEPAAPKPAAEIPSCFSAASCDGGEQAVLQEAEPLRQKRC